MLLVVAWWGSSSIGNTQSLPELPVYTAMKTEAVIQIDGDLHEPAWQQAPVVSLINSNTAESPELPTTVQCLWDDDFLYIGFFAEDRDVWATMTEHDSEIWREEVFEVFIDADSDMRGYAEFQVNPLSIPVDLWILADVEREYFQNMYEWDCKGYQFAVSVQGTPLNRNDQDDSWSAELAIPLKEMVTAPNIPPIPGDTWRINFYRMERKVKDDTPTILAWSPCFGGNHTPRRFGTMVFMSGTP